MPSAFQTRLRAFQRRAPENIAGQIKLVLEQGIETPEELEGLLFKGSFVEAATACYLLGGLGRKSAAGKLIEVLRGKRPDLWYEAAKALARLGSALSVGRLVELAQSAAPISQRAAATYALTFIRLEKPERYLQAVTGLFLDRLQNSSEAAEVRAQAAEGLAEWHEFGDLENPQRPVVIAALLTALDDPAPELRFWAAFALGKLRAAQARPALERLARIDTAIVPGWWAVGLEAEDALSLIAGRQPPERSPAPA